MRGGGSGRNAPCSCGSGRKYKLCCLNAGIDVSKPKKDKDAVVVLMPTRGTIAFETHGALSMHLDGVNSIISIVARKPIVEARTLLAKSALDIREKNPFDFVPREWFALWVDDDCWWPAMMIKHMLEYMRTAPHCDALFGKFGARVPHGNVFAWRQSGIMSSFPKENVDCGPTEFVEIAEAGFHLVLMRMSLLDRVGANPFDISEGTSGEDVAFCRRAKQVGARLFVGMGLPALHIDPRDGCAYLPGEPTIFMDGNAAHRTSGEHAVGAENKDYEMREYGPDYEPIKKKAEAHDWQSACEKRRALFAAPASSG